MLPFLPVLMRITVRNGREQSSNPGKTSREADIPAQTVIFLLNSDKCRECALFGRNRELQALGEPLSSGNIRE